MRSSIALLAAGCLISEATGFAATPGFGVARARSMSNPTSLKMVDQSSATVGRRALLSSIMAASSALVAGYPVQAANEFDGDYTDPKHPGCSRTIVSQGAQATVTGADGKPACKPGEPTKAWKLEGKISGEEIFVDFSPKGGPKDLLGKWDGSGIRWPDGNKWSKK